MGERRKFDARLLDGESMTRVYRDSGISRKAIYKIFSLYRDIGMKCLIDRSRRPYWQSN